MVAVMSQRRIDAAHGNTRLPHFCRTGAGLWACSYGKASEHGATPMLAWCAALGVMRQGGGWWMWWRGAAVRAATLREAWRLWVALRAAGGA